MAGRKKIPSGQLRCVARRPSPAAGNTSLMRWRPRRSGYSSQMSKMIITMTAIAPPLI